MGGLFITGTDTGVGKTIITAALAAAARQRGLRVAVMKPVETGCSIIQSSSIVHEDLSRPDDATDNQSAMSKLQALATAASLNSVHADPNMLQPEDANFLREVSGCDAPLDLINPYRYAPPVAPALAAELTKRPIDIAHLLACLRQLGNHADLVLVEGAGGLMVPLSASQTMADLIAQIGFATVVVGRSALGTINHCLLTLEMLKQRKLPLAGVVLNRQQKRISPEEAANPLQIERFAGDVVRGVFPFLDDQQRKDPEYLAQRMAAHVDIDALFASACQAN